MEGADIGMLDLQLGSELRRLELRTKRRVTGDLIGRYRTAFRGRGLVFTDLREYQPGDDIRHIDWKATARSPHVYVRSFEEERTVQVMLLVDVSKSTRWGGRGPARRFLEFSALVALLASHTRDAVGACLFSDTVEQFIPVSQSRGQVQRVIRALAQPAKQRPATDLTQALEHLSVRLRPNSLLFILSDLFAPPFDDALKESCRRHDVVCVVPHFDVERELPKAGLVQFSDAESGERFLIDTRSANVRRALQAKIARREEEIRERVGRCGGEVLLLGDSALESLVHLLSRRAARLR